METIKLKRAYKSEIFPDKNQKVVFSQSFGNRRYIYNSLLSITNSPINYINYDKKYSVKSKKGLQKILTDLKEINDFLSLSHSQSNQEAAHALNLAWNKYYDELKTSKDPNKGKPNFKKRHRKNSFYIPNQNNIEIFKEEIKKSKNKEYVYIKPLHKLLDKKFGKKQEHKEKEAATLKLKSKLPKEIFYKTSKITGITISKEEDRYFVSLSFEYELIKPKPKKVLNRNDLNNLKSVGIDLGFKQKTFDSDKMTDIEILKLKKVNVKKK